MSWSKLVLVFIFLCLVIIQSSEGRRRRRIHIPYILQRFSKYGRAGRHRARLLRKTTTTTSVPTTVRSEVDSHFSSSSNMITDVQLSTVIPNIGRKFTLKPIKFTQKPKVVNPVLRTDSQDSRNQALTGRSKTTLHPSPTKQTTRPPTPISDYYTKAVSRPIIYSATKSYKDYRRDYQPLRQSYTNRVYYRRRYRGKMIYPILFMIKCIYTGGKVSQHYQFFFTQMTYLLVQYFKI